MENVWNSWCVVTNDEFRPMWFGWRDSASAKTILQMLQAIWWVCSVLPWEKFRRSFFRVFRLRNAFKWSKFIFIRFKRVSAGRLRNFSGLQCHSIMLLALTGGREPESRSIVFFFLRCTVTKKDVMFIILFCCLSLRWLETDSMINQSFVAKLAMRSGIFFLFSVYASWTASRFV